MYGGVSSAHFHPRMQWFLWPDGASGKNSEMREVMEYWQGYLHMKAGERGVNQNGIAYGRLLVP